jgi:hypothetical protein
MKLRAGHIAFLVVVLIGGFVVFAVTRPPADVPLGEVDGVSPRTQADAAFLASVREKQDATPMAEGVGSIRPGGTSQGGPRLELATTEVDVGVMPNNALGRYTLPVKNTGDLPLLVQQVNTTCECTRGVLPEGGLTIPPGGEGSIEIVVDPYRIPGFHATRKLTIKSTDPVTPFLEFNVTSHIDPEVAFDRETIDFGMVPKGESRTMTARMRQVREEAVTLERADGRGPFEEVVDRGELVGEVVPVPEAEWTNPGKAEYDIHVRLTELAPSGKFNGRLYLTTNVNRLKALSLQATAEISAPYTVAPGQGDVLAVPNKPESSAAITLTGPEGIGIGIVRFDAAKYEATVRAEEEPEAAYIDVKLNTSAPAGPVRDVITFEVTAGGNTYTERTDAHAIGVGPAAAALAGE